ncbi:hypothetical protein M9Y10_045298 [Tritrichomonas musculus]|uniref:Uncharacterized protein n=1 Tax=Tritrichomonas musculus TaxID=1915356 RepID=A0ABR2JUV0_9EUKA
MKAGKIPRIFGRQILSVTLCIRKPNVKLQEIPVKLALGQNDCEVYADDWSKCFHSFAITDGRVEQDADGLIHFTYTHSAQGTPQNVEFLIKFDRFDVINNAFNQIEGRKSNEASSTLVSIVSFNDVIQFASEAQTQVNIDKFKQFVEAQARKRILFLSSSSDISQPLQIAIAVEFRMRFPQIDQENWTEAFEVLWFEFVAFCVSLWSQCLKTVIEPHTGPNSFEYYRRLAASISTLIAKGADIFQVDRREFLVAVRKFLDTGDPSDIPSASLAIVNDVELALGNVRKRWLLQLTNLFEFAQIFSASIAIAQSVLEEDIRELKILSNMLSSWALGIVNNITKAPRITDFKIALEKLSIAILKANDSRRYDPEFHCTLALWKLSELVRTSD